MSIVKDQLDNTAIIFIFNDSFPNGGASANRILTLGKGLKNEGHYVEVIIIRPTEHNDKVSNNPLSGNVDGMLFKYMVRNNIWSNRTNFGKLFAIIEGFLNSIHHICKSIKSHKKVIIIDTLSSIPISFGLFIFSKFSRLKFVIHLDEYPWPYIFRDRYNPVYRSMFFAIKFRLYDGLIVMTSELSKYYSDLKRSKAKICHIPMTVDPERFAFTKNIERTFLVTYCGSMSIYKDGVDLLIESFSLFSTQNPEFMLQLIGKTEGNPDYKSLLNLVNDSGLEQKVIFTGEVPSDRIPRMLAYSDMLVLTRRNNIQAQGGFPTKIGEYLLTGKPIVLTNFGEISEYLTDGVNSFISEEATAESFSGKMDNIAKNFDQALEIGAAGCEAVKRSFDYRVVSKRLSVFLMQL